MAKPKAHFSLMEVVVRSPSSAENTKHKVGSQPKTLKTPKPQTPRI